MTINKKQRSIFPILYFICISILFFLPGSAFPKNNWLSAIYFDKWVHIVLFFGMALLCCWGFSVIKQKHLMFLWILLVIYGLIVEAVQDQLIKNRSFDLGDWAADITGSVAGILIWNLKMGGADKK